MGVTIVFQNDPLCAANGKTVATNPTGGVYLGFVNNNALMTFKAWHGTSAFKTFGEKLDNWHHSVGGWHTGMVRPHYTLTATGQSLCFRGYTTLTKAEDCANFAATKEYKLRSTVDLSTGYPGCQYDLADGTVRLNTHERPSMEWHTSTAGS